MATVTSSSILCHHSKSIDTCNICQQRKHTQLITNLDTLLAHARPRLRSSGSCALAEMLSARRPIPSDSASATTPRITGRRQTR